MAVTLKDIARRLRVDPSAVSRVLNGREHAFINDQLRESILKTAHEMGYRRNPVARALTTGRTNTVAVLMGGMYPFQMAFLDHIQPLLAASDYDLLILNEENAINRHRNGISEFLAVDGLICLDVEPSLDRPILPPSDGLFAPVVCIGTFYDPNRDYVGIDVRPAMLEAVRHLVETGRRSIALMCNPSFLDTADAYRNSFMEAVSLHGASADFIPISAVAGGDQRLQGLLSVKSYIAEQGLPDAIIGVTDTVAIGAYRGLLDLGIRVPDEVAILGFDGVPETRYLSCPLSTVQTPFEEICSLAWEFLRRRTADPTLPPQQTILPAELIIRESSAAKPADCGDERRNSLSEIAASSFSRH